MADRLRGKRFRVTVFTAALLAALTLFPAPGFPASSRAAAAPGKVFVLCYHSFLGNGRFDHDVSIPELASQLDFLKGKGFSFVTFSELSKGTVTGTKNVLVVIDDGNQSVYQAYHEVFKPRNIRPMLAIYPNVIGKKSYALTWERLGELADGGCDIAAHGYYHMLMNQKYYDENREEFIHEITGPKEVLEKRLNRKITAFVYPNGVRADITKKILREAGYSYAFTINWGALLSPLALNKDLLELPRYMVLKGNWGMISGSIAKASGQ